MGTTMFLSDGFKIEILETRFLTAKEFIKYEKIFPNDLPPFRENSSCSLYCWNSFAAFHIPPRYVGSVLAKNTLGKGNGLTFSPCIVFDTNDDIPIGTTISIKGIDFFVIDNSIAIYADKQKFANLMCKGEIYEKSRLKHLLERWTEFLFNDDAEMPGKTQPEITKFYFEKPDTVPNITDVREFEQVDTAYIEIDKYNTLVKYIPAVGEIDIVLPEGIEAIRNEAFALTETKKAAIKSIHLPRSLKFIEIATFWDINDLETITVHPENVAFKVIDGALFGCKAMLYDDWVSHNVANLEPEALICYPPAKNDLTDYTLPYNVSVIVEGAFSNCQLENITIDATHENKNFHIGVNDFAFRECNMLKTINFINFKKIILAGFHHFDGCNIGLQANFSKKSAYLIPEGFISKDKKKMRYAIHKDHIWNVPDGIEKLEDQTNLPLNNCWYGLNGIKKVFFPNSFQEVNKEAFMYNAVVEEVYLGENTRRIGSNAFCSCTALKILEAKGVEVIDQYALNGCNNLEKLILGPNCEFETYGWPSTVVIEAPKDSKTIELAKRYGVNYKEI